MKVGYSTNMLSRYDKEKSSTLGSAVF